MKENEKILIIGNARNGKDYVAEVLCHRLGITSKSSSYFLIPYVREHLKGHGLEYDSDDSCYDDRGNHRLKWVEAIRKYNTETDLGYARLATELLKEYDIYTGMRTFDEFEATKHLFDYIIYVQSIQEKPDDESMEIHSINADFIIWNDFNDLNIDEFGWAEDFIFRQFNLFCEIKARKNENNT